LIGVLFTFPSRYWFTIGHKVVFSLTRWSSQIPSEFHVLQGTRDTVWNVDAFAYGAFTLCRAPFQALLLASKFRYDCPTTPTGITSRRFRLIPVRSPLLGKSRFLSIPSGTEMFQFPKFAS